MKAPVKGRETVPWISEDEIPAVKLMLSAWRKLRKDKAAVEYIHALAARNELPAATIGAELSGIAEGIEHVAALERRVASETAGRIDQWPA